MRYTREIRDLNRKSRACMVSTFDDSHFIVKSPTGRTYTVGIEEGCDCNWAYHGGTGCSHQFAAIRYYLTSKGWKGVSFWPTRKAAVRQHRHLVPWRNLFVTGRVAHD